MLLCAPKSGICSVMTVVVFLVCSSASVETVCPELGRSSLRFPLCCKKTAARALAPHPLPTQPILGTKNRKLLKALAPLMICSLCLRSAPSALYLLSYILEAKLCFRPSSKHAHVSVFEVFLCVTFMNPALFPCSFFSSAYSTPLMTLFCN